jgi:hypothetical protein
MEQMYQLLGQMNFQMITLEISWATISRIHMESDMEDIYLI